MTDVDFSSLLGAPVESAERPKPIPTGPYTFIVTGHKFDLSKEKKTPYVRFICKALSPGPGVDQALLVEVPNWREREMKIDFYLTQDALFRLREFLEHLGMSVSGRTFAAVIPETTNATFEGHVIHEFNKQKPNDPPFANIGSTAKAA